MSNQDWSTSADAWLTIQIAVDDRDDLLGALNDAAKEARRLIRNCKDGEHEREFCSGAERITIRLSDEGT